MSPITKGTAPTPLTPNRGDIRGFSSFERKRVDPVFIKSEENTKKGKSDGIIVFMQSDSPSVTAFEVSAGFKAI